MNGKVLVSALFALLLTTSNVFAAAPDIRFSEIHYDNVGTDAGEAIEISGPAGTDVTGWKVVLYNASGNGTQYNTQTLSGTLPATCGDRGVKVVTYPVNGIQNGGAGVSTTDPDGFALIDSGGNVVEFLSYEGVFVASDGPATGLTSTDIGVREAGSDPVGFSLARTASGTWGGPAANTFGVCNDAVQAPVAVVVSVTVAPSTASIAQAATQQFTASAFDAANQPIAGVAFAWTSSVPSVATVTSTGVATGVAAGSTIVTATAPNGILGTAALTVTATPPGNAGVRFSEIHYDNVGVDTGEAIEVEGPPGTNLAGLSIVLYDGTGGNVYSIQPLSGVLPTTCSGRGVVVVNYPENGVQNGSPDGFALVDASGNVIEFLSYEGVFTPVNGPAAGMLSKDIGAAETSVAIGQSLQRDAANQWTLAASTFGACNGNGPTPPTGNNITFTGRTATDAPLPVGFQDQIFATLRNGTATVPTTFTFSSDTPAIATIDQNGVFTALAAGTAILRATAANGTVGTLSLPTRIGVSSNTAIYTGNAQFGEPQDADLSDDFLVRYPQYTASYNQNRGTPNWVSYVIDPTDFGPEDRCDCFTFDPALPAAFRRFTTADYTGAGAVAGFGIDRGHMVRSFDRTAASQDNAVTFYFTNIVPQTADLNQGPWSTLEIELGNMVRMQNKEVFIIAGPAGNKGTVKNEGKIVIPTSTWKIAAILPQGMSRITDIRSARDVQIIAVNMPNDPGVRNVPWQTYITTVNAVEQVSGYDFLDALPNRIERLVETNGPLEDLSNQVTMQASGLVFNRATQTFNGTITVANTGLTTLIGPLQIAFDDLPPGVTLANANGKVDKSPFLTLSVSAIGPLSQIQIPVQFSNPQRVNVTYTPVAYSGQF